MNIRRRLDRLERLAGARPRCPGGCLVVAIVEGDRPAPNAVAPCKCGNPGVVLHVVRKIVAAPAREHP
jgi:hypothetical protein